MSEKKKWPESEDAAIKIGLLLILVWGIVMTFLVPSWQTPDEHTHLIFIGESWENDRLADVLMKDMSMDQARIRWQYEEKMDIDMWREAIFRVPEYSRTEVLPSGIRLSVIKHLPASLGILLGLLLHLPTFWVMELGELFALAFAVLIFALALSLMPIRKDVLLLVMAFPMTVQQISSINYDSVLLPLCFLFVAYLFYLRMEKERVGWREMGIILLLIAVITYIKLPYVFLGALVLCVPGEKVFLRLGSKKIDGKVIRKWRVPAFLCVIVLICAGLYIGRDNRWIRLVMGMALEGGRSIYLFAQTARAWWRYLIISSVGQFGWLEASVPFVFVIFSYLFVLATAICGEEERNEYSLTRRTQVLIWAISLVLCILVCMSMVNHTIMTLLYGSEEASATYDIREALYQIPYIGGLQGRYFLPFLVLPFLALPRLGKRWRGKFWFVNGYIAVAAVLTIFILIRRYWIG